MSQQDLQSLATIHSQRNQGLIQRKKLASVTPERPKLYEHKTPVWHEKLLGSRVVHAAKPLKMFWLFDIQKTQKRLKIISKIYY